MPHVVWSIHAQNAYLDILDQLFDFWGIAIVERFEGQTEDLIHLLTTRPFLGKPSYFEGLRKIVINKHISLIYRINAEHIEVVTFIFNKSDHIF